MTKPKAPNEDMPNTNVTSVGCSFCYICVWLPGKNEHSCKTKNTKARKNFNNCIENKEVKSSNKWVCVDVLIWN